MDDCPRLEMCGVAKCLVLMAPALARIALSPSFEHELAHPTLRVTDRVQSYGAGNTDKNRHDTMRHFLSLS